MISTIEKKKIVLKKSIVEKDEKSVVKKSVKSKNSTSKKDTVKKAVTKKKDTVKKTAIIKKDTKKEFSKEGQIKITPPENDSLRKFYTSLLKQKTTSEMAIKWCTEHGLFPGQKDNIYVVLKTLSLS